MNFKHKIFISKLLYCSWVLLCFLSKSSGVYDLFHILRHFCAPSVPSCFVFICICKNAFICINYDIYVSVNRSTVTQWFMYTVDYAVDYAQLITVISFTYTLWWMHIIACENSFWMILKIVRKMVKLTPKTSANCTVFSVFSFRFCRQAKINDVLD